MLNCCKKENPFEVSGPREIGTVAMEYFAGITKMIFVNSYKFKGKLNIAQLEESFDKITNNLFKFGYQLILLGENKYAWKKADDYKNRFRVVDSKDIDKALEEINHNVSSILQRSNNAPMALVIIKQKHNSLDESGEFYITQINRHTYMDVRGAIKIFNTIINHYNIATHSNNDASLLTTFENAVQSIKTVDTDIVTNELMSDFCCPSFRHLINLFGLFKEVYDVGEYSIPLPLIQEHMLAYNNRRQENQYVITQLFDINNLVQTCKEIYPEVTKNSIIVAALVKMIYEINVNIKNKPTKHKISFTLAFDMLTSAMREKYSGNYSFGLGITVNGEKKLEEVAKEINNIVQDIRKTKAEVTSFMMYEKIIKEYTPPELVDLVENAKTSFFVSNWTNYDYETNPNFLNCCQTIHCRNHVITEYQNDDILIASLSSKVPNFVISFAPNGVLCITLTSLREDTNSLLSKHMSSFFGGQQKKYSNHQEKYLSEEKTFEGSIYRTLLS